LSAGYAGQPVESVSSSSSAFDLCL